MSHVFSELKIRGKLVYFLFPVSILIIGFSIVLRAYGLEYLPGINGDEAWYGVVVKNLLEGNMGSLQTPTGLPLNLFYVLPLALGELCFPQSNFWSLRFPAFLSGLLFVFLVYPLMSRVWGKPRAIICACIAASLPIHIAYSRFGWDASQTPLVSFLCLYFSLRGRLVWACFSFVAALWIHPTNVFLLPIILGLIFQPTVFPREGGRDKKKIKVVCVGFFIVLLIVFFWINQFVSKSMLDLELMFGRLLNFSDFFNVYLKYGQLLSGATIYTYIVGPLDESVYSNFNMIFGLVSCALVLYGVPKLIKGRDYQGLSLLVSLSFSLVLVYVVSGYVPLMPATERYGMFLTVPSCLLCACLLFPLEPTQSTSSLAKDGFKYILIFIICTSFLFNFCHEYLIKLKETGGNSELTFRTTNNKEPKLLAWEFIKEHTSMESESVIVGADGWWTYWPLNFLSKWDSTTIVFPIKDPRFENFLNYKNSVFLVGFDENKFIKGLNLKSKPLIRKIIKDSSGKPILYVWKIQ